MKPLDDRLLHEYLDSALDADDRARVEGWLARDAGARARFEHLRALFTQLETPPDEPLPRDFSAAVVRGIQRTGPTRSRTTLIALLTAQALFAAAAWVLALPFAASLGTGWLSGGLSNPLTNVDLAARATANLDVLASGAAAQIATLPVLGWAVTVGALALLWVFGTGALTQTRAPNGNAKWKN